MPRSLAALGLLACLALAAAGCGSGSSPSTSTDSSGGSTAAPQAGTLPPSAQPSTQTTPQPSTPPTPQTTPQPGAQAGGSGQGGQGGSGGGSGSSPSAADNSIQAYGSAAGGARKSQIAKAAFAFFKAMAAHDYAGVCKSLVASNRAQLEAFLKAAHRGGGCPAVLRTLIPRAIPEARKAAQGTLTAVRVKGDTAFVLFRPKGGRPSYFVMKREGGAWRAISLAPGTPLNPLAG